MQSLPPYLKDILRREAGETGGPPGYVPVSTYSSRSSPSVQKSPIRNRFMEQAGEIQRERTRLKIATGHFIVRSFGGFRTSEKSHHCARSSFSYPQEVGWGGGMAVWLSHPVSLCNHSALSACCMHPSMNHFPPLQPSSAPAT